MQLEELAISLSSPSRQKALSPAHETRAVKICTLRMLAIIIVIVSGPDQKVTITLRAANIRAIALRIK